MEAQVPNPERVEQQPRIDVEAEAEDDPVSPEPEQVDRALEDPEMEERTTDLEASLDFKVDKSFDEPEWDAYLPPSAKIVEGFNSLKIPQINTDQKPTPMTILQFVCDMMGYRRMDPAVKKPVMAKAFQGRDAERWCRQFNYNLEMTMCKLLNRMFEKSEWIDLKGKWEKGEKLAKDLDRHIHFFKLIAKYWGEKEPKVIKQRRYL